jgi:hypothetical protein
MREIIGALLEFHKNVEGIPRDGENPFHNSRYATLAGILNIVRPLLATQGLVLVQGLVLAQGTRHDPNNEVCIETHLYHTSGESMTTVVALSPRDRSPQAVGSAITYGRRYGILALLCLATEDDDGNAASAPPQKKRGEQVQVKPPHNPSTNRHNAAVRRVHALIAKAKEGGSPIPPLPEGWENLPMDDIVEIGKKLRNEVEGGYND